MQRDSDGKPALLNVSGDRLPRRCSISHTRNWLACAFSDVGPIGIDIEVAKTRDYVATGTWFFGAELGERLVHARPESQRHLFYQAWTAYEALYKCGVNKRREMAPLLRNTAPQDVPGIALHWLLGPQQLHACVAVLTDAVANTGAVCVFRFDGVDFAADARWSETVPAP
ncbi:MAG: 4'-phosphopantetheinyl transferase superfamily protein [Gammaproteobacteria bacterium]|nr:4'-phosphopantetheinyl transferase superfamily protein [Gammaproteobacteria bacterium]